MESKVFYVKPATLIRLSFKMGIMKEYLFWRKHKGEAKIIQYTGIPCSLKLYCIAPNSFKITRENWRKQGLSP